eukprot:GSA25T00018688001.1
MTERFNTAVYEDLCALCLKDRRFFELFQRCKSAGKDHAGGPLEQQIARMQPSGGMDTSLALRGQHGSNMLFYNDVLGELDRIDVLEELAEQQKRKKPEKGDGDEKKKKRNPLTDWETNPAVLPPSPRRKHYEARRRERERAWREKRGYGSDVNTSEEEFLMKLKAIGAEDTGEEDSAPSTAKTPSDVAAETRWDDRMNQLHAEFLARQRAERKRREEAAETARRNKLL